MRTDTLEYGPIARYNRLVNARNRKVDLGISLYLWKSSAGVEQKGMKK